MSNVLAVMAQYGSGRLTAQQAANALRPMLSKAPKPAPTLASSEEDPAPDDRAGGDGGYGDIAYALHSNTITLAQYSVLAPLIA